MTGPKRRHKRIEWVVFLVLLLLAVGVSLPLIQKQRRAAMLQQAFGNTRSLSCAFLEFDQEFGSFPSRETHDLVQQEVLWGADSHLPEWTGSANDCFRQLIAYGIQSESIFFAVHPEGSHEPDEISAPLATEALKPGEAGLSYVYGLRSSVDPALPLLLAPMKTGTHLAHGTYHQAVVRFSDGSGRCCPIDRDGEILLDGTRLLDPARPCWRGRSIDIRHPEFPR